MKILKKLQSVTGYHWGMVLLIIVFTIMLLWMEYDEFAEFRMPDSLSMILINMRSYVIVFLCFLSNNVNAIKRRFASWLCIVVFFAFFILTIFSCYSYNIEILPVTLVVVNYIGAFFVLAYIFFLLLGEYKYIKTFIELRTNYPEVYKPLFVVIVFCIGVTAAICGFIYLDDFFISQRNNLALMIPLSILTFVLVAFYPLLVRRYGYVIDE